MLTYTAEGRTPGLVASNPDININPEPEVELRPDPGDDGDLEREVAQLLERMLANLEIDSGPGAAESIANDERQPVALVPSENSTPTWCTSNRPLHRRPLLYAQADLERRERDKGRQDRDKHLLSKWPRGKGPDRLRLLLEGLYLIP